MEPLEQPPRKMTRNESFNVVIDLLDTQAKKARDEHAWGLASIYEGAMEALAPWVAVASGEPTLASTVRRGTIGGDIIARDLAPHPASGETEPVAVSVPASELLAIRDALLADDLNDAWHHLYTIADPAFCELEPWRNLEHKAALYTVSPSPVPAYVPQVIEFEEGQYAQLLLEDAPTVTGEWIAVEVLYRMGTKEVVGVQWDLPRKAIPWPSPVPAVREASNTIARFNSIIEAIEARCMATDGPVTPTLKEMTEQELTDIWACLQFIRTALQSQPVSGRARPTFDEAVTRAFDAVKALDDWTNVNETEFTGWDDGAVPPMAEFWRVKSGQALRAVKELLPSLAVPSHNGGE